MINTLQLAARKNLIQMSSDVINYNYTEHKTQKSQNAEARRR
jgi:hypothetical protein